MNKKNINIKDVCILSKGSDRSGFVFKYKKAYYRAIEDSYQEHFFELYKCGVLNNLLKNNLIPQISISDFSMEGFNLIFEVKEINPIISPL